MKAKIKTREQLVGEGFKISGNLWRKGKKFDDDTVEVSYGVVNLLAGQTVSIAGMHCAEKSTVDVKYDDEDYIVPLWMFQEEPTINKLPKKQKYSIGRGDFAEFYASKFTFPCDVRELELAEVRKLAEWVLKVSR